MKKYKGKQRLPILDNLVYSNLIFQVSAGNDYPQKIYEFYHKKKSASVISRQLDFLETKEGFLISMTKEDRSKFPMEKIRIYSIKWEKIISEFLKYVEKQIDYVVSENKRLGMNIDKTFKDFEERIKQAKDETFQEAWSKNKLLQSFFKRYYATIGELRENWTISATFDFLSFFGDLNFITSWGRSHGFYNIEKAIQFLNQRESITFPDWLKNEKKPETEAEEFERFKKIHKHTTEEFDNLENKNKQHLNDIMKNNREVVELFYLSRILEITKIKPSLQVGLNDAVREVGKEIFKRALTKEQIKKYWEIEKQIADFTSSQEQNIIEKDLADILGEEQPKVQNPSVNKANSEDKA
jgi:hypothetical protein